MREPKRRLEAAVTTEQLRGAPPLRAAVVNQSPAQYLQHRNSNKKSRQYAGKILKGAKPPTFLSCSPPNSNSSSTSKRPERLALRYPTRCNCSLTK
jgi:hypothetical protein